MCFFFNDTATTEIYTLSLHDALPIYRPPGLQRAEHHRVSRLDREHGRQVRREDPVEGAGVRSEEHTSELQSRQYLVCRLLLEKKKSTHTRSTTMFHVLVDLSQLFRLL